MLKSYMFASSDTKFRFKLNTKSYASSLNKTFQNSTRYTEHKKWIWEQNFMFNHQSQLLIHSLLRDDRSFLTSTIKQIHKKILNSMRWNNYINVTKIYEEIDTRNVIFHSRVNITLDMITTRDRWTDVWRIY